MNSKLIIPDLGVDVAEVVEIAVKVGDSIQAEQDILTLETDKASMEVPASVGGTISELSIAVGDSVTSGQVIGSVALGSAELYSAGSQGETQSTELPGSAELYSAREDKGRTGSAELHSAKKAQAQTEAPTAIPLELSAPESTTAQLLIPDLGVDSAEVVEIAIKVGDSIEPEQEILTLETDKASMEVPANVGGTVQELSITVGDSVHSGQTIGLVMGAGVGVGAPSCTRPGSQGETGSAELYSAGKEQGETQTKPDNKTTTPESPTPKQPAITSAPAQTTPPTPQIYAGPAVRKLAREFGVDLAQIQGSGTRGRIVKQDVQAHVKQRLQQPTAPSSAPATTQLPEIDFSQFGSIETIAMSKVQRLTAAAMSTSLQVAPQVSHHDKANITALEQLRKASKEFAAEHGVKLTALPLLIKACALALQQFPEFNSSLVGDNIVRKHYIHIGIAVDSPHGLFVPVIRDVDKKSIFAIAREAAELAAKAQSKSLKPADMQGGCFSISSLGALGGEYFTPIVNWPEAAILGVCQARMQQVYINGEFSARLMLPLSLSYDHRLINGAAAARFTNYLIKLLAQPSFIMA